MVVGQRRDTAPARRAVEKADLHQIRLIDILQRDRLLADGRRQRLQPDRASAESRHNAAQHAPVDRIQSKLVDFQRAQGGVRRLLRDDAVELHLREIAHAAQQAVGDARRAARAARDFIRPRWFGRNLQNVRRARDNLL